MTNLNFYISEYVDGNLEIEAKHLHYAFRDDLNKDDFPPQDLLKVMREIEAVCTAENIKPNFIFQ